MRSAITCEHFSLVYPSQTHLLPQKNQASSALLLEAEELSARRTSRTKRTSPLELPPNTLSIKQSNSLDILTCCLKESLTTSQKVLKFASFRLLMAKDSQPCCCTTEKSSRRYFFAKFSAVYSAAFCDVKRTALCFCGSSLILFWVFPA
ncbi:Uncharacterised protein [Bartonella quintana]|nr:Uncharacterised protein [Bartonella quintana]